MQKLIISFVTLIASFSLPSYAQENIEFKKPKDVSIEAMQDLSRAGGMQFIDNKTNKTIVLRIGDYFPTKYTFKPKESKWISVSTNRQSIEITEVR